MSKKNKTTIERRTNRIPLWRQSKRLDPQQRFYMGRLERFLTLARYSEESFGLGSWESDLTRRAVLTALRDCAGGGCEAEAQSMISQYKTAAVGANSRQVVAA